MPYSEFQSAIQALFSTCVSFLTIDSDVYQAYAWDLIIKFDTKESLWSIESIDGFVEGSHLESVFENAF